MSIYTDLLFLGGHVGHVDLARSLAVAEVPAPAPERVALPAPTSLEAEAPDLAVPPTASAAVFHRPRTGRYPMRLFQGLIPLVESPSATPGLGVGDRPFESAYGNRGAWQRRFPAYGSSSGAAAHPTCRTCPA